MSLRHRLPQGLRVIHLRGIKKIALKCKVEQVAALHSQVALHSLLGSVEAPLQTLNPRPYTLNPTP